MKKSIYGDFRLDKEVHSIENAMIQSGCAVINRIMPNDSAKIGAYRCINNKNVDVEKIETSLRNQLICNIERDNPKDVIIIQDTMEVIRESKRARLSKKGRTVTESVHHCAGARVHSMLVSSLDSDVPLGFSYLNIWGRKPEKDTEDDESSDPRYRSRYYMTDPKSGKRTYKYHVPLDKRNSESSRWIDSVRETRRIIPDRIHLIAVQDREGDMYPLHILPEELINTDYVVRAAKNRKIELEDGHIGLLMDLVKTLPVKETYQITIPGGPSKKKRKAEVELSYASVTLFSPTLPKYTPKSIKAQLVYVRETAESAKGQKDPVEWILFTSLTVNDIDDAHKIVQYYRKRWFIEDYHRLLKRKGFGIEDIQVETDHGFYVNLALAMKAAFDIAVLKKAFDSADANDEAEMVFPASQIQSLDEFNALMNEHHQKYKNPFREHSLAWAAWIVASYGGWSGMPSQPKPGVITFKRGYMKIRLFLNFMNEFGIKPQQLMYKD